MSLPRETVHYQHNRKQWYNFLATANEECCLNPRLSYVTSPDYEVCWLSVWTIPNHYVTNKRSAINLVRHIVAWIQVAVDMASIGRNYFFNWILLQPIFLKFLTFMIGLQLVTSQVLLVRIHVRLSQKS